MSTAFRYSELVAGNGTGRDGKEDPMTSVLAKGRLFLLLFPAMAVGFVLQAAGLPIPFMLGGILVAACLRFTRCPALQWPKGWRELGLSVAGYGIGLHFTRETLENLTGQTPGVLGASVLSIALAILIAAVTARHTRANLLSCVLGQLPGGLSLMMLLAEEDPRADANVVIVEQTTRIFMVVFTVPIVASLLPRGAAAAAAAAPADSLPWLVLVPLCGVGVWAACRLHVPTPTLMGPILATSCFSVLWGAPLQPVPDLLLDVAQISVGLYMGCMLDRERLLKARETLGYCVGGTLCLIAASMAVAFALSRFYGFGLVTAFLAMAPGGIAEMCLAGMSMGADVSVIVTYQIVRVLLMNLTMPFLLQWYFNENYKG